MGSEYEPILPHQDYDRVKVSKYSAWKPSAAVTEVMRSEKRLCNSKLEWFVLMGVTLSLARNPNAA
jgi:hypothetical protein